MSTHALRGARQPVPRAFRHAGGGHHAVPIRWWDRAWGVLLWLAQR